MIQYILCSFLLLPSVVFSAIFDCFLYFNEAEICRIRLEELYPVVDHFIILEFDETFTGHKKGFNFLQHEEEFQKFRDKIIYFPLHVHCKTDDPWVREAFQRAYLTQVYPFPEPTDLVLISDADEIPKAASLQEAYTYLLNNSNHSVVFIQTWYKYYLNRREQAKARDWDGTSGILACNTQKLNGDQIRYLVAEYSVRDGGWHFASMVPEKYDQKLKAYSHTETNNRAYRGRFLQRKNALELVPIDESYPLFIQQNQEWCREKQLLDKSN